MAETVRQLRWDFTFLLASLPSFPVHFLIGSSGNYLSFILRHVDYNAARTPAVRKVILILKCFESKTCQIQN